MSPTAALPGLLLLRPCVQILPGLFLFLALEPAVKCLPLTGIRLSLFALPDPLTHTPLGSNLEKVPQWLRREKKKNLRRKALDSEGLEAATSQGSSPSTS